MRRLIAVGAALALAACVPADYEPPANDAPPAAPVAPDECGHRECGEIGYGFGYNFSKGEFGLGFGSGGVNYF